MDTPISGMDKPIAKKKGLQKKHIGYLAIVIAMVALIYMAFFTDQIGRAHV